MQLEKRSADVAMVEGLPSPAVLPVPRWGEAAKHRPDPESNDPNDPAGLADAVGRAAATDWRAAAWMLEHHPLTREQFGDQAHMKGS